MNLLLENIRTRGVDEEEKAEDEDENTEARGEDVKKSGWTRRGRAFTKPLCKPLYASTERTRTLLYYTPENIDVEPADRHIKKDTFNPPRGIYITYDQPFTSSISKIMSLSIFISSGTEETASGSVEASEGSIGRWTPSNRKEKGETSAVVQPPKRKKQEQG